MKPQMTVTEAWALQNIKTKAIYTSEKYTTRESARADAATRNTKRTWLCPVRVLTITVVTEA